LSLQDKAIVDIQRGILSVNATTNIYSSDSLYSMISDNTFGMYPITPSKYPHFIKIRTLVNNIYLRSSPYINGIYVFSAKGTAFSFGSSADIPVKSQYEWYKDKEVSKSSAFHIDSELSTQSQIAGMLMIDVNSTFFKPFGSLAGDGAWVQVSMGDRKLFEAGGSSFENPLSIKMEKDIGAFHAKYANGSGMAVSLMYSLGLGLMAFAMTSLYRMVLVAREEKEDLYNHLKMVEMDLKRRDAQIDSHFLYNTLNCIHSMAYLDGETGVADVIMALSNMFRYVSTNSSLIVSLRTELEYLSAYITIQRARLGEGSFSFEADVPEQHLDAQVPRLLLQPIVENSFVHGFKGRKCGNELSLKIFSQGGQLMIQVRDNGRGFDSGDCEAVLAGRSESVGLANIRERLRICCKGEASLVLESQPGKFAQVTVKLPLA
jgi:hypothetical protein